MQDAQIQDRRCGMKAVGCRDTGHWMWYGGRGIWDMKCRRWDGRSRMQDLGWEMSGVGIQDTGCGVQMVGDRM